MQSVIRSAFPSPFDKKLLPNAEAAVLIGLRKPDCRLILTRRAAHLRSHAGEVALPGGRHEPADGDLATTALRESHEEVGLPPGAVEIIGAMPGRDSRFGLNVLPLVGFVDAGVQLSPNPEELHSVFEVPLEFFLSSRPELKHVMRYKEQSYLFPCFEWQGEIIWGLTGKFIVSFLECVFDHRTEWPDPVLIGGNK